MPKYVNVDWLIAEANQDGAFGYLDVDQIEKAPTAFVVEVVMCKECTHNPHSANDDICPFVDEDGCVKYFPEDCGFCKWGERSENGENTDVKAVR